MRKDYVNRYVTGVRDCLDRLPAGRIEEIARALEKACRGKKQIFVFGNGGSAATASHFACDIGKSASCGRSGRFKVICLNESVSSLTAYANDMSYADVFAEQLKNLVRPGDVVIAISASGRSANVLAAVKAANRSKAFTVGLTGFDGGRLAALCRLALIAPGDDMQKIEDMHLVIMHILMQMLGGKR